MVYRDIAVINAVAWSEPVNRHLTVLLEVCVGAGEGAGAEEAGVSGEGRGVRRLNNQVLGAVNVGTFGPGIVAPEDKDEVLALCRERGDSGVSKLLPSPTLMTPGHARFDREGCVQEQHALCGPSLQVASPVCDWPANIRLDFFKDILERRRERDAFIDREAQAVGLPGAVVGILAQDDDFYFIKWAEVKRTEDMFRRWVHYLPGILLFHELCKLVEIGLFEFFFKNPLPRWIYLYLHKSSCVAR